MEFVLKRDVQAAAGGQMVTVPAGSSLADISAEVRDQLAPDHFAASDGSDTVPPDWRPPEAAERDQAQIDGLVDLGVREA
jgi:hypothetical protein